MSLLSSAAELLQKIPRVDQLKKDDQAAKQVRARASELREARAEYVGHRSRGGVLDPKVRPDSLRVQKTLALLETYRGQFENPSGGSDGWVALKRSISAVIKDIGDAVSQGIEDAFKPLSKAHKDLASKNGVARALGRENDYLVLATELTALKARDWKILTSTELAPILVRAKRFLAGWEKLGLVDLPNAVENFLAKVHTTGASLEDFEAEGVREWLESKKLIQKVRIIFRE